MQAKVDLAHLKARLTWLWPVELMACGVKILLPSTRAVLDLESGRSD